jgi:hypothetical protein
METWHKRHALQLASQLPDNATDASLVMECLQDLMTRWLHPASDDATPATNVLTLVRAPDCA